MEFVNRRCTTCGIRLTEFEYNEKGSLCMECYHEKHNPQTSKKGKTIQAKRNRNKRTVFLQS